MAQGFASWRSIPWIIYIVPALLLAAGTIIILQNEAAFRIQASAETQAQAEILAATVTAALDFEDAAAAQEAVAALAVNRRIRLVEVADETGRVLAAYRRSDTNNPEVGKVAARVPVNQAGAELGSVNVIADLEPLSRRLNRYLVLGLLFALAALAVAILGFAQAALRRANHALENQAAELAEANLALRSEIQERERAEAAQAETDALYRAYVENTSEHLFVLQVTAQQEFLFLNTNPANAERNGFGTDVVRGRRPHDLFDAETADRITANYRRAVVSGRVQHYAEQLDMPSGPRHFETVLVPIRDTSGRISRIMGSSRDVTERVALEEALRQSQKMEAMGQLTGGIAHDFNNLLGAVVGNLDLIRRRHDDPAKVQRWAEAGLQAAERGAKLTGQLLAFSRAQRLQLQPVNPAQLINGMQDMLARTLGPMVRLSVDLDQDGMLVLSDPTQLEMAVLNLAINARDAMPDGGDLTIATRPVHMRKDAEIAEGDYVELCVSDTGAGMTPEVLARALDPFFTTKEVGKGTGLGLSQVYGMARQGGGTIRITSEVERGTTVKLLLKRTSLGLHQEGPDGKAPTQAGTAAAHILVIDDDADVRRVLVDSLDNLGHLVTEAGDGASGLDLLRTSPVDLVIVDYAMPGMTGAQVATEALQLRPDLPIIFVSGYSDTDAIERAVGSGAMILSKPFRVEELQRALSQALSSTA